MRADRLLSILLLLQVRGRLTTRELASRLEVSDRTIHRDMDALSGAGIPVYAERGTGGGWALLDEYRTDLTGLTDQEIHALFAATPTRLLTDLGLNGSVETALLKLLATLPSPARHGATQAQQSVHIDLNGWQQHEDDTIDWLPTLRFALAQERKIQIIYQRSDESTVTRTVDPLGLVANRHLWYLIAAADGEPRTYRVSRIQQVQILDQPLVRPVNFELATYWDLSKREFKASLPAYHATLQVAAESIERLAWGGYFSRVEQVDPADEDGWCTVAMRFESEEDAASYVIGYGVAVIVIEPLALRNRVIQMAEAIQEHYAAYAARVGSV